MQKFLLLIKEIVNCNYPDGEKLQESNDRSVDCTRNPKRSCGTKTKSMKLQEKQEKDRAEKFY